MTTYLLFGFLCVLVTGVLAIRGEREPQCHSRFDYEYKVIQNLVRLDEAQTRLEETLKTRESEITEQENEMRKLTDLVNKTLKEVENQKNTVRALEVKLETVNSQLEVLSQTVNSQLEVLSPAENCQTGEVVFYEYLNCAEGYCKQSKDVEFKPPFHRTPLLMKAFSYLDAIHNTNLRALTEATELTRQGVTLTVGTWGNSLLYGAKISWIACPRYYS